MVRRRPVRPARKRVFIGTEGRSEAAFAAFLQDLCNEHDRHLHLDIYIGSGGAPISIFKESSKRRKIGRGDGTYVASLCVMDRHEFDRDARRQEIQNLANREGPYLILLAPNFEGLLVRLFAGNETRQISAAIAQTELRKLWPDYQKPPLAKELKERFSLADLRRAALHDEDLDRLLRVVRLS